MKFCFDYYKSSKFDINRCGIQVIENDEIVEIYNDPFRTVPLFITRNQVNDLIVFSDFNDFYGFDLVDKSVDEVGFWEII